MKIRQLITAVIALSAITSVGSAFADRPSNEPVTMSTKTRAEVRAELDQARADGLLMLTDYDRIRAEWGQPKVGAAGVAGSRYSGRTRAEVRAELEQARADGTLMLTDYDRIRAEWSPPKMGAQGVAGSRYSGRTREEVRAEAIEYMKNPPPGHDDMYRGN